MGGKWGGGGGCDSSPFRSVRDPNCRLCHLVAFIDVSWRVRTNYVVVALVCRAGHLRYLAIFQ